MKRTHHLMLERLKTIAGLLRAGQPVRIADLAVSFECSGKTVRRDLEFLQDRFGYELKANPAAGGYTWSLEYAPPAEL